MSCRSFGFLPSVAFQILFQSFCCPAFELAPLLPKGEAHIAFRVPPQGDAPLQVGCKHEFSLLCRPTASSPFCLNLLTVHSEDFSPAVVVIQEPKLRSIVTTSLYEPIEACNVLHKEKAPL